MNSLWNAISGVSIDDMAGGVSVQGLAMRQWCARVAATDIAVLDSVVCESVKSRYLDPGKFGLIEGHGTVAGNILITGKALSPAPDCTNGGGFANARHGMRSEPWLRALVCLGLRCDHYRAGETVRVRYECGTVKTALPCVGDVHVESTTAPVVPGCEVVRLRFPKPIVAYGIDLANTAHTRSATLHIRSSGNTVELTVQVVPGQSGDTDTLLAVVISWSALAVLNGTHIEVDVPPASVLDEIVGKPTYAVLAQLAAPPPYARTSASKTRTSKASKKIPLPEFAYTRSPRLQLATQFTMPSAEVLWIASDPRTLPHTLGAWVDWAVAFKHAYRTDQ